MWNTYLFKKKIYREGDARARRVLIVEMTRCSGTDTLKCINGLHKRGSRCPIITGSLNSTHEPLKFRCKGIFVIKLKYPFFMCYTQRCAFLFIFLFRTLLLRRNFDNYIGIYLRNGKMSHVMFTWKSHFRTTKKKKI